MGRRGRFAWTSRGAENRVFVPSVPQSARPRPTTAAERGAPPIEAYSAFSSSVISLTEDFASPNSIAVFSP
jgi:hypothetical protein